MNVGDLFTRLSYGELSNLSIGGEGSGTVTADQADKLAVYANHALTQIFSRFAHKKAYVTLALEDGRQSYKVAADEPALVLGPGEIFPGPVIKIVGVTRLDDPATPNTDETEVLGINRRGTADGIKITAYDTVFVDAPKAGEKIRVEYRARHEDLVTPVDLTQEILVHPALEEALELNIAQRVYSAMNGQENLLKARELKAAYEEACARVSMEDLLNETETDTFDRLRAGGWI